MRTSTLSRLAAALVAICAATAAHADGFATANVQVLQAWNMDDQPTTVPTNGDQTVVTFNYFGTHRFGDLLFFLDVNRAHGHFLDGAGNNAGDSKVYGELQPRFGINKILGRQGPIAIFKDFGPAFELNQGENFYAYLGGVGGDFNLPGPYVAGLNVYYRYDKFVKDTWQATAYWGIPVDLGFTTMSLQGFADFSGFKSDFAGVKDGLDVMTQPQVVFDVLKHMGTPGKLWVGAEWYVHLNPNRDTQALQAMLQWTLR
jgi:nucleoside-specific outer membrane channel protein Tsx